MIKILLTAITVTGLFACKNEAKEKTDQNNMVMETTIKKPTTEEKGNVIQLAKTLFRETDNRNWEAVKATMADSIYVDYTALGGEAGYKTPEDLVSGWQQLLPGFDRTIHQVHNFAPFVADNRATATMDAIATHYLDGEQWTVFVGYDTEYIKENENWKLARIDLSLYDQTGNTKLPLKAMEAVKNGDITPLVKANKKSIAIVQGFFDALEARDLKNVLNFFTKNAVQEMPLSPKNFPKKLKGIDAIKKQYAAVMDYIQSYDIEYFGTQEPNIILAKYQGTVATYEGKPYNNSYVGVFTIANGKISNFLELFNPKILLYGWPGLEPATYSVHSAGASTDSGVAMKTVTFNSNGNQLRGHLFLPPNFKDSETYPSAIVTGSWTSVKEQMPDEYASLLAKDSFITLTFDFTGFGESEGQPRFVEDYRLKIKDIRAAVDYLSDHPNIDKNEISGLGVCASAGYMAHATAQDARIKKLVLVAPWLHNAAMARAIYDNRPGGTDALIESAKAAKERYAETGEMKYVLAASELDPLSAMYVPKNAFDYYLDPAKGAGPKYDNLFAISSWEPWLTFDGISAGKDIKHPVFIVHSKSSAVPQGAKDFYELLKGEKDIVWLNEYNQQQLYFVKEAVDAAMKEVTQYLK